jgi:hypothetical protein
MVYIGANLVIDTIAQNGSRCVEPINEEVEVRRNTSLPRLSSFGLMMLFCSPRRFGFMAGQS